MSVDAAYLYAALLSYNYFPMAKKHRDEIPSLFSTESFGTTEADELLERFTELGHRHERHRSGFDQIAYRTTRFNNATRLMHIPTPMGYARLCRQLRDSWHKDALRRICRNPNSLVRPKRHCDGRLIVSAHYEDSSDSDDWLEDDTLEKSDELSEGRLVVIDEDASTDEQRDLLLASTGMSYYTEADVSACFPSIYTHSIPWALVGLEHAKKHKGHNHKSLWFNQLDERQRMLKRGETLGVPIGPATSNIACEIVLFNVDQVLRDKGYIFTRRIDDYKAYSETREKAEAFIRDLERELAVYLLSLNASKLKIEPLPRPFVSPWVLDMRARLPTSEWASPQAVADYLDYAVSVDGRESDGSVIKYAARALSGKLMEDSRMLYCQYVLSLAVHSSVVLPVLCEVIKGSDIDLDDAALARLLRRHVEYRRSDAIGWTIKLFDLAGAEIPEGAARAIVDSGDCMSMAALLAIDQLDERLQDFVTSLDPDDLYLLDRYWILLHELHLRGMLPTDGRFDRYVEESGLAVLEHHSVSFLTTTEWESDEEEF